MVVDQATGIDVDRVFHALADATRRDVVIRVLDAEQSVSALARRYPISLTAVQKHVAVLEGAGLVSKRRRGREQLVTGQVEAISTVRNLLDGYEQLWRGRVDRMSELLAEDDSPLDPPTKGTTDE